MNFRSEFPKKDRRSLRIAQVSPLYERVPPELYGGTERVVSYLTEELVRQGHQVTLFASGDSVTDAKLVPPVSYALRLSQCNDPFPYHLMMIDEVARRSADFDIIHWHIDYLHFPVSRRLEIANVTTLHGRLDLPDLPPLYRQFNDMPLVSISDAQRLPLPAAAWQGTVYHGLPPKSFTPSVKTDGYLAFLGRISAEKRPDRAIEIARRAGVPLKIAAKVDKADRDYFETEIRPMIEKEPLVEFIGEIGDEQKNAFLGGARALLFPIDWPEPFGMVMIEAMACGTPVIAYPHGSVPEILHDGETAFLVRSIDEAVDAVSRLGQLSRARCRQVFEERFSVEQMALGYLKVYEALIHERNRVQTYGNPSRRYSSDRGPVLRLGEFIAS